MLDSKVAYCGRSRRLAAAVTVALGGLTLAQVALADEGKIEEIVVTAQKREQRAQDVGITLNAFSGDQLQKAGVVTAPDIAKLTPGVGVSGSFAGQNVMFSVRGVTQQDFQAHAESPIAVYVDEGYMAANNAAGIGLFDIDHVEVLKGPQGTLFGRNATGGLVSITTNKPTKDLSARASLSYGSYNDLRAEGAVGGPLTDTVQARFAGVYEKNDGWVDNVYPGRSNLGGKTTVAGRVHLAAQPSDDLSLLFTAYASDVQQSWGPYFLLSTRSVLTNGVPNAVVVNDPTQFGEPPSDLRHLRVDANNALDHGGYNRLHGGTLRANYDFSGGQFTSITDYKKLDYRLLLDDDASAVSFLDTDATAMVKNWSQEFRLYNEFDRAKLTSGLYYLHIDGGQTDLQRLFGLGGVQTSSPFRLKTDSYSLFSQVEYQLDPAWTAVLGGRATRENKDYQYNSYVQNLDGSPIADGRSYRGNMGEWLYSWKAQIEYRPVADVLTYLGYSRGTKAGSFNAPFAGGPTPPDAEIPYKPEKLDAFELGAKTTLAGGQVTLNGAVFYYDYKDYQAFKFVNFSTVVTNNPATIKGAEFDLNWTPVDGLDLMLGGSYVDAVVKHVPVSNSAGSAVVDRLPPFSSKWQGIASARYAFPLLGGTASVQADAEYTDKYYFSLTNFDATRVDAHTLVNARVAWTTADGHWEVAAFGKNLTDKRYGTVGFEASDFGGWTQTGVGEPRWYGASFSYKY